MGVAVLAVARERRERLGEYGRTNLFNSLLVCSDCPIA
jgi:hypothetical protein